MAKTKKKKHQPMDKTSAKHSAWHKQAESKSKAKASTRGGRRT